MWGAVLGGVLGALGSRGGKSTTTAQLSPEQRALIEASMPTLLSYINTPPELRFDPLQLKGQQQMLGALPQMQRNYMDAASLLGGGSTSPPPNAAGSLSLGELIAGLGEQPSSDFYARPKIPEVPKKEKKSGSSSTNREGGSDGWEAPGPGRGGIGFGPGRSGPGSGSDYGGPESNDPGRGSGFGGGGGNGNSGGGRASGGTGSRGSRN